MRRMDHRVRGRDAGPRGAPVEDVRRAESALEELLADDLLRIKEFLNADTIAVLLLDEHGEMLVARAASGLEEEVEQGVRIPVGKGFAGPRRGDPRPVVIEDVDHADVLNPILREKGIRSLVGVPMEVADKLLGVLHVGSLTPRVFGDHDIAILKRAARRVAIPVEQAALYGTERGARVQLEAARGQLSFLAEASAVLGVVARLRDHARQPGATRGSGARGLVRDRRRRQRRRRAPGRLRVRKPGAR